MILRIVARTLRGQAPALALLALGLAAWETLIPVIFRSFGGAFTTQFYDRLPTSMRELMEAQFGLLPTADVVGWLGASSRHPIYLVLICAFVIAAASGAIAREIERGTILMLLARPLPRYLVVSAKALAILLGLVTLMALGLAVTIIASNLAGVAEGVNWVPFLWVTLNGFLVFLAIAGYSLAISAATSDGGQVISRAAAVTLAFYFLDFLATLWEPAEKAGLVSLFHYYRPSDILRTGTAPWSHLVVLAGVAIACLAASVLIFQRRDISA